MACYGFQTREWPRGVKPAEKRKVQQKGSEMSQQQPYMQPQVMVMPVPQTNGLGVFGFFVALIGLRASCRCWGWC
jgi:hypothetical protein